MTIEHDPEEVSTRRQSFPFVSPCRNVSPLHDQQQKEGRSQCRAIWLFDFICLVANMWKHAVICALRLLMLCIGLRQKNRYQETCQFIRKISYGLCSTVSWRELSKAPPFLPLYLAVYQQESLTWKHCIPRKKNLHGNFTVKKRLVQASLELRTLHIRIFAIKNKKILSQKSKYELKIRHNE